MNRQTLIAKSTGMAVALLLLASSGMARAGVLWTADFSTDKPSIVSQSGDNQLIINPEPLANGNGNATVSAFQLNVKSPFIGTSDSFTAQNYSLNMTLTDSASQLSKLLQFSGNVTGTITPNSAQITNAFNAGQTSYAFDLGTNHYDVTIGPFTPQSGNGHAGLIDATISAAPIDAPGQGNPPPVSMPEPSTLVMAGTAVACLCRVVWKKHRSQG
jgi:hypothetical protein